jgi:hypothetical protein
VRGSYEDGQPLDLGEFGTLDPAGEIFLGDRFWFFDSTLYRDDDDTLPNEAFIDGRWTPPASTTTRTCARSALRRPSA